MKYNVVTVGILVADIMTFPVDESPAKGVLQNVDGIKMYSGGNAMTAAINISKLGLKSAVIGKVGSDVYGEFLIDCLKQNEIETKAVAVDESVQTSVSVVLSGSDGERSFLHCKGANAAFDIADIDFDMIENTDIVFVTGSLLLNNFDGRQTVEFLKKCKQMGKTTALDVCWDSTVDFSWIVNSAMPYIDLFMPSIDEAIMLSGEKELAKISERFLNAGAGAVIIKCGGDGCFVREGLEGDGVMIPIFKTERVVDTTGAGDSFCSGFLTALAKGNSIYDSAVFGNAVGACCVAAQGATMGTLTYDETLEFIKERTK